MLGTLNGALEVRGIRLAPAAVTLAPAVSVRWSAEIEEVE